MSGDTARSRGGIMVAASVAMAIAELACGQVLYTAQTLNSSACSGGNALIARRINNSGTVVGLGSPCFSLALLPFRWTPESGVEFLNLGPGNAEGWATAVHDDGTIVGYTGPGFLGPMKGFIWKDGAYTLFAAPNPQDSVQPYAVDAEGTVHGYLYANNGNSLIPFRWQDGEYLPTGLEDGPLDYLLFDANDAGVVVGYHSSPAPPVASSFRLFADGPAYIAMPSAYSYNQVYAVNRQGTLAGRLALPLTPLGQTIFHGLIAEGDDAEPVFALTDLGHNSCELRDINDIGQAVGISKCSTCPAAKAVPPKAILVIDGVPHNLNDLLAEPVPFKLLEGRTINDRGQIACSATLSKNLVLLTPIVEPPDITIDGKVDLRDLAIVLEHWGAVSQLTPLRADIDESGTIDAADLALVLGAWTPR